jgi:hypothetical protein
MQRPAAPRGFVWQAARIVVTCLGAPGASYNLRGAIRIGGRMNRMVGSLALVGALGVGALAALLIPKLGSDSAPPQPNETMAPAGPAAALPAAKPAPPAGQTLTGTVLEKIDVPNYTYLRIGAAGAAGMWAAVSTADVKIGTSVQIDDAIEMANFTSSTLKRTFDHIYFGALAGAQKPSPHPAVSAMPPSSPHGSASADIGPMHGSPTAAGDAVPVGKVDKAGGPTGYRIAELYEKRDALAGKTIRVRGVVVKVTPEVLGRTFGHLRDGSGNADKANHDLTVTITGGSLPAVGTTTLVEGKLNKDVDFGSGYRYPILLEGVRTVDE